MTIEQGRWIRAEFYSTDELEKILNGRERSTWRHVEETSIHRFLEVYGDAMDPEDRLALERGALPTKPFGWLRRAIGSSFVRIKQLD